MRRFKKGTQKSSQQMVSLYAVINLTVTRSWSVIDLVSPWLHRLCHLPSQGSRAQLQHKLLTP